MGKLFVLVSVTSHYEREGAKIRLKENIRLPVEVRSVKTSLLKFQDNYHRQHEDANGMHLMRLGILWHSRDRTIWWVEDVDES